MAAPLSSVLKSINRDTDDPLHILMLNSHEGLQAALACGKHQFTFISHPQIRPWDKRIREIPSNCQVLQGNDIGKQIRTDMSFDLILCLSRHDQYPILCQLSQQLNCPIASMQYDLSPPNLDTFVGRDLADQPYSLTVFDSEMTANSWGFSSDEPDICVIPRGIDTDFWNGWIGGNGGDGRVMTVVSNYPQSNQICGFDLYKEVTKDLPTNAWGDSPGFSKIADGIDHLREIYCRASVFLNTSLWRSCPMSLLEAMSVGCPIVTTATTTIPDFIENGENGFITNDPVAMKERLEELIKNPDLGKKIGDAGRKTIIKEFGQGRFLQEWDDVFQKVARCPVGRL